MRSVLVTGGSGSFGQAFVRRLVEGPSPFHPERICVYSRGEHHQAAMREAIGDDRLRWFIGDVRDRDRLRRAMEGCDVVVHAAALKRIEVGHYCPDEMVRTNVLGAMNVIEAARDAGVAKVVALSTDKACQPVSAYGYSKALAESLFLAADATSPANGPRFAVTRYGNVAGSCGSVIPKWRALLAENPSAILPVTDVRCTRFWMTMDEAVDLVLDTVLTMRGGELRIPTLPAYELGDLAEAMGARGITLTGLAGYEKLHESMREGERSDKAHRMTVDELREALAHV